MRKVRRKRAMRYSDLAESVRERIPGNLPGSLVGGKSRPADYDPTVAKIAKVFRESAEFGAARGEDEYARKFRDGLGLIEAELERWAAA